MSQELEIPSAITTNCGECPQEDSILDPALLHPDGFNSSHTANHHHTRCTSCGCPGSSSSNKRRSPCAAPSQLTKKPKKLFLDPQDLGFSNISLQEPQPASIPVLCRCVSDPTHPPQSPPESAKIVEPNAVTTTPASKGSASLPPRPPFRRTLSDPSPSKSFSRSSSSDDLDEIPSNKALRKMKDLMSELNLWWKEEMSGEEEDVKEDEDNNTKTKDESGACLEEAVSVERIGEGLGIQFNCPCSKTYKILLSGDSCYYRLM